MTNRVSPLIVLAAGGTGGHMFPAEALAEELLAQGMRLALITDRRGGAFEGANQAVETHRVHAAAVAGRGSFRRAWSLVQLARGTIEAKSLLNHLRPRAVVGFGGYASLPTMLAACWSGIPTLIHEQNAVLGRANRLLARRVDRVATSFERTRGVAAKVRTKTVRVGMPVRSPFAAVRSRPFPGMEGNQSLNLLVLGGSQGARVFARVVPQAVERLAEVWRLRLKVCQQCRPEDAEEVRATYARIGVEAELSTFFRDVPERMAAAHLLVARAGASTVGEVMIAGRPAILVPYPHAADDHQTANALAVEAAGAGWIFPQPKFTPDALAERLESLFAYPEVLQAAAAKALQASIPDATARLATLAATLASSEADPFVRAAA
jgi:UDP-N-acetylglucosamine--N-acetylmuramyl-(pentapeptide) pyrophosphoryl-undecaprenol N-acetylglucosamine transferase